MKNRQWANLPKNDRLAILTEVAQKMSLPECDGQDLCRQCHQ